MAEGAIPDTQVLTVLGGALEALTVLSLVRPAPPWPMSTLGFQSNLATHK